MVTPESFIISDYAVKWPINVATMKREKKVVSKNIPHFPAYNMLKEVTGL